MRHSPRELLKVRKSDRGQQKSIPTIFRCARWVEYGLGRKDERVIFSKLTRTMKFDKTRAVEEQIQTIGQYGYHVNGGQ